MLIKASNLAGIAVVDKSRYYVGSLKKVILDPVTGFILAYQLKKRGENFLSPMDIVDWHSNYLELKNGYELHASEELWRAHQVISQNQSLIGKKVKTQSGIYLGICRDLDLNVSLNCLHQIEVVKNIWHFFPLNRRLISHSSILDVDKKQIIVRDNVLKLPLFAPQPLNRGRAIIA